MSRAPRHPRAGVALLEVMIALIIMAMTAAAIAVALATLAQTSTRLEGRVAGVDDAVAQGQVMRWARAMPSYLEKVEEPLLDGDADRLTFWTIDESGRVPAHIPLRVTIAQREGTVWAQVGVLDGGAEVQDLRLASGGRDLRISYWGRHVQSDPPRWDTTWDQTPRLPSLIRLNWTDATGNPAVPLVLEPGRDGVERFRDLNDLVLDP